MVVNDGGERWWRAPVPVVASGGRSMYVPPPAVCVCGGGAPVVVSGGGERAVVAVSSGLGVDWLSGGALRCREALPVLGGGLTCIRAAIAIQQHTPRLYRTCDMKQMISPRSPDGLCVMKAQVRAL